MAHFFCIRFCCVNNWMQTQHICSEHTLTHLVPIGKSTPSPLSPTIACNTSQNGGSSAFRQASLRVVESMGANIRYMFEAVAHMATSSAKRSSDELAASRQGRALALQRGPWAIERLKAGRRRLAEKSRKVVLLFSLYSRIIA